MKNQLNIGETFHMGNIECTITQISAFSGTAHYGFTYEYDNGKLGCGWMPVLFVDRFSGHSEPKVVLQNSRTGLYYVKGENFNGATKDDAAILNNTEAAFVRAQFDNVLEIPA